MPTLEDIAKAKDARGHGSNKRGSSPFIADQTPPGWNHREAAAKGIMHHSLAQHHPVGWEGDVYGNEGGDKVYGRVTHNNGKTMHFREFTNGTTKLGRTHRFTFSSHYEGLKKMSKLSDIMETPARTLGALFKRKDAHGHGSDKKSERHTFQGNVFTTTRTPQNDDNSESHDVHHKGERVGSIEYWNGDGRWYAHGKYGTLEHRGGSYKQPQTFTEKKDAVQAIADHHLRGVKVRAAANAAAQAHQAKKEHERLHGNEYTGPIHGLHEHMNVHRVDHNWITGETKDGKHKVNMRVFSEPSGYGINEGRVSTLSLEGKEGGATHVSYDRGWSKIPQTEEHMAHVRNLVGAIDSPKKTKKSEDALWPEETGKRQDDGKDVIGKAAPSPPPADPPADGGVTE